MLVGRTVLQTNVFLKNLGEKFLVRTLTLEVGRDVFILGHILNVQINERI